MFVAVACFTNIAALGPADNVGAVYGPFDSKPAAQSWIDNANFPSPQFVTIRQLYGVTK